MLVQCCCSHLAEVQKRNWRWAPGAGSPGVGGVVRCVPSLASRLLPASLLPRACSPRASAVPRCAPRTPCLSYAAAASQLRVLLRNPQTSSKKRKNAKSDAKPEEMLQEDTAVGAIINFLFAWRSVLFLSLGHHRIWRIYSGTTENRETKCSSLEALSVKKQTNGGLKKNTKYKVFLNKRNVFTFAVVEKLLCEDRYIKDSSVLPFCILLLIARDNNMWEAVIYLVGLWVSG